MERKAASLLKGNRHLSTRYPSWRNFGFGRRVKIVERSGGTITSTKQFVWVGTQIAEERDANNVVQARFWAEGYNRYVPNAGAKFYTRDHLGSIREVTDSGGNVMARYDYDPYGRVTKVSGSVDSDFLFTGHYYHAPSGLHLALYRAYDAELGRWLNRDPIAERGGINLYGYVGNDPGNAVDPDGRSLLGFSAGLVVGMLIAAAIVEAVKEYREMKESLENIKKNREDSEKYNDMLSSDNLLNDPGLENYRSNADIAHDVGKDACEKAAEVPGTSLNMSPIVKKGLIVPNGGPNANRAIKEIEEAIDSTTVKARYDTYKYLERHYKNTKTVADELEYQIDQNNE